MRERLTLVALAVLAVLFASEAWCAPPDCAEDPIACESAWAQCEEGWAGCIEEQAALEAERDRLRLALAERTSAMVEAQRVAAESEARVRRQRTAGIVVGAVVGAAGTAGAVWLAGRLR